MPFNGSGSFSPYTPGNPAVSGTTISSTAFNNTVTDFATGLSNAMTRDGQSPATANIPMGGKKITGLGDGSAATDAATVGQTLTALAVSSGSSLVGHLPAGTGMVATTVKNALDESISVLRAGAVANGSFTAGGSPSGTDNYTAFNVAISAAITLGISKVHVPGGQYYLSQGITLPRGITLEGDGIAHLPIYLSGTVRGTVLLINGRVGADCISFAENSGTSGLRDIAVFNTNTNAIRSVVSIVGHLYPRMCNVEIASLRRTIGSGLFINSSVTGALFETLWGDFDNVICNIANVGSGTEASVRWGVNISGTTITGNSNANSFRAGQFAGTWGGLLMDSATSLGGALSCVFHGTKFDTNYDGTFAPQFQAAAAYVYGANKTSCYIYPVVQIKKAFSTAFHGCYFEVAGAPANYNDGINGSFPILGVVWLDSQAEVVSTGLIDCNFNGVFLFDKGSQTQCTPTTSKHNHNTRQATHLLVRQTSLQSIPPYIYTKIVNQGVVFGDDSELEWDATNSIVKIRTAGTYLINAQVEFAGWAVSVGNYGQARITSGGYSFTGNAVPSNGLGVPIQSQVSITLNLAVGDSVLFEVFQSQGTNQNTNTSQTYLDIVKI